MNGQSSPICYHWLPVCDDWKVIKKRYVKNLNEIVVTLSFLILAEQNLKQLKTSRVKKNKNKDGDTKDRQKLTE